MGNTILHFGTHPTASGSELCDSNEILLTPGEREELIAALIAQRDTVRTRVDAACAESVGHTELTPVETITASLLRTWSAANRTTIVQYAKGLVATATPAVNDIEQWATVAAALGLPAGIDARVDGAWVTLDEQAWRTGIGAVHALGHGRVDSAHDDDPFDVFRPWSTRHPWIVRPEHLVLPDGDSVALGDYVTAVTGNTAQAAMIIVRAALGPSADTSR
ncbi:hypothetical protein [Kutzneria sp. 744]|uniref:hypothetical protein n=1 Tax=Kutzneria sp. (strain 744) TaxID=345341 RepID=UPI0012FA0A38|nr:hypothetical protein [Kutzneria sp. 744]